MRAFPDSSPISPCLGRLAVGGTYHSHKSRCMIGAEQVQSKYLGPWQSSLEYSNSLME